MGRVSACLIPLDCQTLHAPWGNGILGKLVTFSASLQKVDTPWCMGEYCELSRLALNVFPATVDFRQPGTAASGSI